MVKHFKGENLIRAFCRAAYDGELVNYQVRIHASGTIQLTPKKWKDERHYFATYENGEWKRRKEGV